MKSTKLTLMALLALVLALAAAAPGQTKDGDRISVPLSDPSRPAYVKASLMNGSITVKAYSGREVIVEATSRPGSEADEWDEEDEEVTEKDLARRKGMRRITNNASSLTVQEDNNEVEIGTGWRGMSRTLDLVVQVPVNSSLKLNTMNEGDITVTGVKGDVEVSNLNGNIAAKDVDGSVVADAMNGDIDVVFSSVDPKKSMSFSSMNGEIDVTVPPAARATFTLKSDMGEIYSDFDLKLDVATENIRGGRKGKYKVSVEKVMTGSINGGGAEMKFTNFNGNIYIRKGK